MNFDEIFDCFEQHRKSLKVLSIASADLHSKPNSAAKIFVDIVKPNTLYFLDYRFTTTYANVKQNPQLSVSFMDDAGFTGYRLTGVGEVLETGPEFEKARKSWEKRLISFEAQRIVARIKGEYSTKYSESSLPKDFVIVKFTAKEGSVIMPDRFFRASP